MKNLDFLGFPHHAVTRDGRVYSLRSGRFLKLQVNQKGYHNVGLYDGDKVRTKTVHRLVALSYIPCEGVDPLTMQVNHIDGNKLNNTVNNLEWVTLQENVTHSVETGLRDTQLCYSDEQIHILCRYMEQGFRNKDLASMTGIHPSKVSMIRNGLAYQHISCEYTIEVSKRGNRISTDKILDICKMLQDGLSPREISMKLNVGYQTVRYIKRRETYQDISKNFKW